jgi:hypothetical protein
MRERRDGAGGVKFSFPLENSSVGGGEDMVANVSSSIRDGLGDTEACYVSVQPDAFCTWVTARCPENVSAQARAMIEMTLENYGLADTCREAVRDVLEEGEGDPVFYPRTGGRGSSGGGFSGGDGGGAAFQC